VLVTFVTLIAALAFVAEIRQIWAVPIAGAAR
jgi:hypothetical protein